jgi:hypothetical protein
MRFLYFGTVLDRTEDKEEFPRKKGQATKSLGFSLTLRSINTLRLRSERDSSQPRIRCGRARRVVFCRSDRNINSDGSVSRLIFRKTDK